MSQDLTAAVDRQAIVDYFDRFVEAFATFDGAEIARRYRSPYLAVRADGSSELFESSAAIREYFQRVVDRYQSRGCRACRYRDLEVAAMGPSAALATVTWELLDSEMQPISSWRESYNLVRSDGRLAAVASIDHAPPSPSPQDLPQPEVIGLDHVYLTVSDLTASTCFYDPVMRALGFRKGTREVAGEPHVHYFCPALQVSLRPAHSESAHDPYAPGLHHLCLQLPDADAVDRAHAALSALGIEATEPAHYPYSPGYHATFFQDPDGLRLELVARTPYRDQIARNFHTYSHFQNPIAALEGEREGVFHIATDADLEAARERGIYSPPSLATEGFIHCSTRSQVLDTANRFYSGRGDLHLLQLDAGRLAADLVYEAPNPPLAGETAFYPHLYSTLPLAAVLAHQPLRTDDQGRFTWPAALRTSNDAE